jgi:hypothetical protein
MYRELVRLLDLVFLHSRPIRSGGTHMTFIARTIAEYVCIYSGVKRTILLYRPYNFSTNKVAESVCVPCTTGVCRVNWNMKGGMCACLYCSRSDVNWIEGSLHTVSMC